MICFLKFEMYFYPRKPKLVIIYCSLLYIAIFNLLIFTSILLYFYIYSHIFMNLSLEKKEGKTLNKKL